ncbi:MFS transporter [Salipaludibacillus agaradhaerens]|jgi:predicted MFS family arabinose efflux permease|uniref:MFS transporter n=1 Tax=Salipaludibacillus agaradhaerens TaxID=76935 RepID=A0A9Q4B502_SALAG|nr:MFS transporter [Salipaludibacillus agaradhaerens]MCR6098255.1 MFS transporter [Salipaludibacillus agaradhaerens]MCR6116115.1 MFS transporter [Salipaludibacillus agaradhaerens]
MWVIVLPGIAMIGVTYAFARFNFGLFLPNISSSLGITATEAGIASSAAYIAFTLALLTSSYMISKFNEKRVIQFAGISATIGLLGIGFSYEFNLLVCSTFIAGLGSGWASPAFSQVAKNSLSEKDSDRGNTWINTGTSFGLILSGPVALLFTEQWRLSFILFAFITVLVLIWNTISIPLKENSFSEQNLFKKSILKKAKFLLIASLIIGFCSSIFWTFSRTYLQVSYNMNSHESVSFWVLMGASGIVGGIAGGAIHKVGLSFSYRTVLIAMSIATAIITTSNILAIYLSAILFGISYTFLTGTLIVWGTRIFKFMPSIGVSLAFLSLGIGQSVGSAIAGEMITMTSYAFSFILYSAISFIGLLVPIKLKDI